MSDDERKLGDLKKNKLLCKALEENPGCPFVRQIYFNSADIGWLKKYFKIKSASDIILQVSTIIAVFIAIWTIANFFIGG